MRNLKIGKKLLVTFGCIIALFCITVFVSLSSLQSTGGKFTNFYDLGHSVTLKAMDMRRAIQSAAKNIGYATMVSDQAGTQSYIDACEADLSILQDGIAYLQENFTGDKAIVTEFLNVMSAAKSAKEQVYEYALRQDNENASRIFFKDYQPALVKGMDLLSNINKQTDAYAKDNYDNSKTTIGVTTLALLLLSILALFITVALALYITKSLTRPIKEIETAADQIVLGNLDVSIGYQSKDELGRLSESVRKMTQMLRGIINDMGQSLSAMGVGDFTVDSEAAVLYVGDFKLLLDSMRQIISRLTETLSQIGESSDQVSSGADQVSSGAQSLSQGATEQASSVEELAATINEISQQIKTNAMNAKRADELVDQTSMEVTRSNEQMREMISAMSDISSSSSEIGKIIKTIEDIAFQTNILALNAAVEAARAGEAGKGFAVVADEVRNLASKSAEASKSTSALIENSLRAVENGTRIANETAHSLSGVVEGTQHVTDNIAMISESSGEQAQNIAQVTQGIDQISSVVQNNSAAAEQSAAASEELSSQAQMLKDLVAQFKLKRTSRDLSAQSSSASAAHSDHFSSHPSSEAARRAAPSSGSSKY